ncbi:hypothetical protein [Pontibacter indicus]|uniref:SGNH/GDSL hydrolase family protein n=1 Tax=Pontibacter indicus TaxID=1317125 RepID=A0A1R3WC09_9BACT|nr:hypothetical protein [Pontibacter indicus]SIT75377.1 hypothetical protein SAMN05444128_0205 [Pontibacter indicus]
MNRQLLRFLKKLAILGLILYATDFTIGNLLEYFYFRINPSAPAYFTTYALNEADEDVIVFGSSRAQHHYDPTPFESSLHKTFYNTGKDGQGILYSYVVLKSILERSPKPRIILLDLNPNEFHSTQADYDRLTELLPYYHTNKVVQEIVTLKGPFEKFKAHSYLYRYNSQLLTILMHNLGTSGDDTEKGYEPIPGQVWKEKLKDFAQEEHIDSTEVRLFGQFIEEAKKANCEVYIIISPTYRKYQQQTRSTQIAQAICDKEGVFMLDFNQDPIFLSNRSLFVDPTHLNEDGATLYSKIISAELTRKSATVLSAYRAQVNTSLTSH